MVFFLCHLLARSYCFHGRRRLCRRYGAAAVVMAFDEDGQADSLERRTAVCARPYRVLTERVGFPAGVSSSAPTSSRWPPASRSATYGRELIEATRWISGRPARWSRRRLQRELQLGVGTVREAIRAVFLSTRSRPPRHGHRRRRRAHRLRRRTRAPRRSRTSSSTGDPTRPSGSSDEQVDVAARVGEAAGVAEQQSAAATPSCQQLDEEPARQRRCFQPDTTPPHIFSGRAYLAAARIASTTKQPHRLPWHHARQSALITHTQ